MAAGNDVDPLGETLCSDDRSSWVAACKVSSPASGPHAVRVESPRGADEYQLTITVVPGAPVAQDDAYEVEGTLEVTVADGVMVNDAQGVIDGPKVELVNAPAVGNLTLNDDGSFSFAPPEEPATEAQFTYRLVDDRYHSEPATVTLSIVSTEDPDGDVDGGCGCSSGRPSAGAPLVLALGLIAWRRRRRCS